MAVTRNPSNIEVTSSTSSAVAVRVGRRDCKRGRVMGPTMTRDDDNADTSSMIDNDEDIVCDKGYCDTWHEKMHMTDGHRHVT